MVAAISSLDPDAGLPRMLSRGWCFPSSNPWNWTVGLVIKSLAKIHVNPSKSTILAWATKREGSLIRQHVHGGRVNVESIPEVCTLVLIQIQVVWIGWSFTGDCHVLGMRAVVVMVPKIALLAFTQVQLCSLTNLHMDLVRLNHTLVFVIVQMPCLRWAWSKLDLVHESPWFHCKFWHPGLEIQASCKRPELPQRQSDHHRQFPICLCAWLQSVLTLASLRQQVGSLLINTSMIDHLLTNKQANTCLC